MFYHTCIWLKYFIIISLASSCKAGTLLLENTTRTTICANAAIQTICSDSEIIAFGSIHYGTKISPCIECCVFDEADCLIKDSQTDIQAACSGKHLCEPTLKAAEDASSCGPDYPFLSDYWTAEFYCLPESRMSQMCSSNTLTTEKGNILYLKNQDYPSPIRATETTCSCSVEAKSCDSQIRIYFLHVDIGDGYSVCNGNQKIIVTDAGVTHTYDCLDNNDYVIALKTTTTSNYITVNLHNPDGINDGYFWLGFEATDPAHELTLDCPSKPQTVCMDCGTPTVPNGALRGDTFYNGTASIVCDAGHEGGGTATCLSNGQWDILPSCIPKDCGRNKTIPNGHVDLSNVSTIYGSLVPVTCDIGFKLSGGTKIQCQEDGTWSDTVTCEIIGVNLPSETIYENTICADAVFQVSCASSANIAIKDVQYGSKETGTCTSDACCVYDEDDCLQPYTGTDLHAACSGYELCHPVTMASEDSSSCGASYSILSHYWAVEFYCLPESRISEMCASESNLAAVGNSLYLKNMDYPHVIRAADTNCSCSLETKGCDSQIRVYFLHLELSDGSGVCNANQSIKITDGGITNTYNCSDDNYYNITLKMTASSNYIRVYFENPDGVNEGHFWLGFEATNPAHELTLDCPPKPQTFCMDCGPTTTVMNGNVHFPAGTKYGAFGTVTCDAGYSVDGPGNIECLETGNWSNITKCTIKDCGKEKAFSNGNVDFSAAVTTYGSTVAVTCDAGYTLTGGTYIECLADGIWSDNVKCEKDSSSSAAAITEAVPCCVYMLSLLTGGLLVTYKEIISFSVITNLSS